ncbi:hypothetical protein [Ornithinimicrobium panacihumi]|uniref:hypothetical protein n=1 Tax=Ornithinimicrobium panacihumi TaxID=2008449 RepID=UPI003F8910F7
MSTPQDGQTAGLGLAPGEREQLVYALENRFAPHLEAAAAAVREAEQSVDKARAALAEAERRAGSAAYTSDPRVFMRQGVAEEVDGLERKTNEKRLRVGYRFLLDRAVDLAGAEVTGFHDDLAAAERERTAGVEACREAEERAVRDLAAARAMQERVEAAERSARQGLALLVDKLSS